MDDYRLILLYQTAKSWNNLYFIAFASFPFLIFLIVYHIRERKDIKELLISKHILSTLHTHLRDIIFRSEFDYNRTIRYISDNIETFTGYSAASLKNNKELSYYDLIPPEDRIDLITTIKKIASKQKNYQVEYRIRTKWGIEKWMLEQGIGIFNKKGVLIAVEGILTDITNSKAA